MPQSVQLPESSFAVFGNRFKSLQVLIKMGMTVQRISQGGAGNRQSRKAVPRYRRHALEKL